MQNQFNILSERKQGFLSFKEIDFRYLVGTNCKKHLGFSELLLSTNSNLVVKILR